jgi:hypothetical protein
MIETTEMAAVTGDLWELTFGRPQVDPQELARAVEQEVTRSPLDVRTRLLIRDSLEALARHWGPPQITKWLEQSPQSSTLKEIWGADLGPPGFATLAERIMETTRPETVRQFLRELGNNLSDSVHIVVGGSIALILHGSLSRATEDIDLVDEVPKQMRSQHQLLDELGRRYGLRIAHFQSHFLPTGWQTRVRSIGSFGRLQVSLVDLYDIFVGKLFSARTKDLDDLRHLAPQLDRSVVQARLREAGAALLNEPALALNASKNWYILYGEHLPKT